MAKIKLDVLGITQGQLQIGTYALVLGEENGDRRIPIIIGGFEAQSIAILLEGLTPPRPLTHDLFVNTLNEFDVKINEAYIHKLEDGIFYAQLHCVLNGMERVIDARTSDAIATALRSGAHMFIEDTILDEAGVVNESDDTVSAPHTSKISEDDDPVEYYKSLNENVLNDLLVKAIESEDYEKASLIRDEINVRKQS